MGECGPTDVNVIGLCATAGPIAGNKVDEKGPSITITSPISNTTYQQNAVVTVNYACTDDGSGVLSYEGPTVSGSLLDTSSIGTKTFTVNASDTAGNRSSVSVTYSIVTGGGGGQSSTDLGVTVSAPATVAIAGTLRYSIAVKNFSNTTATVGSNGTVTIRGGVEGPFSPPP